MENSEDMTSCQVKFNLLTLEKPPEVVFEKPPEVSFTSALTIRLRRCNEQLPSKSYGYEPSSFRNECGNYEKSELNNNLIKHALNDQMPKYWQSVSHKPYALNPVEENSIEFKEVLAVFSPTCRYYKITKLERVENPYLLALYLNKKEKMLQRWPLVEEKNLFHGTSPSNVDNICKNNFDWRRRGQARGHKFGQGVSFTPEVSYASHYGSCLMFLAKVLMAKKIIGGRGTVIPPEPYDTTTNGRGTVMVKYEDYEFYPQYVIHYKLNFFGM